MNIKTLSKLLVLGVMSLCFVACEEEDKMTSSIFIDSELDPNSATYELDYWLDQTFKKTYNLSFRYRMKDTEVNMNYNLSPMRLELVEDMIRLIDYLWLDVYTQKVGPEFLKENGPRIIQLVGSVAWNISTRTQVQGTAEGGIKVTLYGCNELNFADPKKMNDYYFITMHHEFCHILHQKKTYPQDFQFISAGNYDPLSWDLRTDEEARSLGFVSPYGSSDPHEDFVETFARYLVMTDAEWGALLEMASKPGTDYYTGAILPDDGVDGRATILRKLDMVMTWCKNSWNIDVEELRKEILKRQAAVASTGGVPNYN